MRSARPRHEAQETSAPSSQARARRRLIIALPIALLSPLASLSQTRPRTHLLGWIQEGDPADPVDLQYQNAFKQGMRELGYVEGRDYRIEKRSTTVDAGNLTAVAQELVALRVEVIVAITTSAAIATRKVSREIPIVTDMGDPVGNGLAQSLAHPGGNVTGMTSLSQELYLKRVDLLRQLVPGIQRVGFLYNPDYAADQRGLKQFESGCKKAGLHGTPAPTRGTSEVESAFDHLIRANVQGLIVTSRSQLGSRLAIVEAAARRHLPAVYSRTVFVDEGGLIAYGPDYLDVYRRCAGYVDKILKGANPGDLPIEQPDKYELAVNLKTARALRINVPNALLVRADKIVE